MKRTLALSIGLLISSAALMCMEKEEELSSAEIEKKRLALEIYMLKEQIPLSSNDLTKCYKDKNEAACLNLLESSIRRTHFEAVLPFEENTIQTFNKINNLFKTVQAYNKLYPKKEKR